MAVVSMKQLLECGVHFGHQTRRWNPKMKPFIFGERSGIYIIDLSKTLVRLNEAKVFLRRIISSGRQVLFVGTKKQAQEQVRKAAEALHQPYVVNRWLGGMLTNNRTIRQSVARMTKIEAMEKDGSLDKLPKKEASVLRHELAKARKSLGGVKNMNSLPAAVFVVDVCREKLAVDEAHKLGIPVIAMVDTNADNVDKISHVIPSNDDAIRSIQCIVGRVGEVLKEATASFAQNAEDLQRQRAIEEAEAKARQAAIDEQRKARDREARRKRAEAVAKLKAESAAAPAPDAPAEPAAPAAPDAPPAAETPATEG